MARRWRARAQPRWLPACAAALLLATIPTTTITVGAAFATTTRMAEVTRVIDGDTFAVKGEAFPLDCGPNGRKRFCDTKIRVRNFDAAELRDYDCAEERTQAEAARDAAIDILSGSQVTLLIEEIDRFGRPVADVLVHRDGARIDFVAAMVERGAGARWRYGEEPQPTWCAAAAADPMEQREEDRAVWREIGGDVAAALGRWIGAFF